MKNMTRYTTRCIAARATPERGAQGPYAPRLRGPGTHRLSDSVQADSGCERVCASYLKSDRPTGTQCRNLTHRKTASRQQGELLFQAMCGRAVSASTPLPAHPGPAPTALHATDREVSVDPARPTLPDIDDVFRARRQAAGGRRFRR